MSEVMILAAECDVAATLYKPLKAAQIYHGLVALRGDVSPSSVGNLDLTEERERLREKRRRVHILLAEDNPVNQHVALKMLEKMGYRTHAVANGAEAIAALKAFSYDLVIMDCQMPKLDGYETTRQIRDPESTVRNRRIPIIALTAHAMKGDQERCINAGMDDYLAKPVKPDELERVLEKWLRKPIEEQTPPTT